MIDKDGAKYSFNANDMIIFNKDVILKNVTFADFEIIKNYDVACEQFAAKDKALSDAIDKLSDDLSTDISALSDGISADVNRLSTWLSTDISALSDWLSADIKVLSTSLSLELSS